MGRVADIERKYKPFTCPDAGIGGLKDLTKEELLYCIGLVTEYNSSAQFWLNRAIVEIADRRRKKKLEEDEAKGDRWINLQRQYEELLKPYAGKKIGELPPDVIEKGAKLEQAIKKAQKEYFDTFETGAGRT